MEIKSINETIQQVKATVRENNKIIKPVLDLSYFPVVLKLFSTFSVIFSITLMDIINKDNILLFGIVFIFFTVVIILNEKVKTDFLQKYFNLKKPKHLLLGLVSVFVSLTSIYGIYNVIYKNIKFDVVYTENDVEDSKRISYVQEIDSLNNKKTILFNSIKNRIKENIESAKDKKISSSAREAIETNNTILNRQDSLDIVNIEKKIAKKEKELNQYIKTTIENKNKVLENSNFNTEVLAYILSLLSLIVELVIISVCYVIGNKQRIYNSKLEEYLKGKQSYEKKVHDLILKSQESIEFLKIKDIVSVIFSSKNVNDTFYLKDMFNIGNSLNVTNEASKRYYAILETIGTIGGQKKGKKIVITEKDTIEKLDMYYTERIKNKVSEIEITYE
jgi:hypothetical protein